MNSPTERPSVKDLLAQVGLDASLGVVLFYLHYMSLINIDTIKSPDQLPWFLATFGPILVGGDIYLARELLKVPHALIHYVRALHRVHS